MAHIIPEHADGSALPTTAKLMKILETSPQQFRDQQIPVIKTPTFHEYLYRLMEEQDFSVSALIKYASISKTYIYQFLNGERIPGRDIILRICLVMRLKLNETQRLLTLAGKSVLYPKIRRDAAILYCIKKKMTLDETNSFLENLGEITLL